MRITIILGILLLTLTACTVEYQKETETVNKYLQFGVEKETNIRVMELRLLRNERSIASGDFDKDDFDDDVDRHLERFFPDTLTVNEGDTVMLAFYTEKPNFITVNGEGYSAKAGTYEFVAEKKGNYEIACADCADNPKAIIRVV